MPTTVSVAQARRIALAAQGFGRPPAAAVGSRQLTALMQRLAVLQLDSVNVFERNHYLPVFSRLGPYDKSRFDELVFGQRSAYTEYWAHAAAVVPKSDWPLYRWRMDEYKKRDEAKTDGWANANRALLAWLLEYLAVNGPLPASKIEHESNTRKGGWWEWSDVKTGLEHLFLRGDVVASGRSRFERTYGLPEHSLPQSVIDSSIAPEDARRSLMATASRALGIGTLSDLADYFRLSVAHAKAALDDLVDAGDIVPVDVDGWSKKAFVHSTSIAPRRIVASAFLSPFDPMVWERDRTARLFDFHYRIEIYVPQAKRIYGYYTLPILLDDRLVGRIDLKSDRHNKVLRVQSAWREATAPIGIEDRIASLLDTTRAWQGHESVEFAGRGDLSPSLEAAWRAL
jgi:uncharacterized protein YcaQ